MHSAIASKLNVKNGTSNKESLKTSLMMKTGYTNTSTLSGGRMRNLDMVIIRNKYTKKVVDLEVRVT
ncbi:hypothetical protein DPMN_061635 [Dreissena polymorpha]|uniref:Uncharacterized protein n=1 Tax=Dreissena polymorpha TaxID=45954 RepID=A0A9D4HJD0_DREPO|nr:hypothetical protein DPMN_061635 [Dreissena polymorpha]